MKLVINAANVHQGGGRTLLLALLEAVERPTVAIVDARLELPSDLPEHVQVIAVAPSILSRYAAERRLSSLCQTGDILLCFGNLPPLFSNPARVFVYLQNRYLTSQRPLSGLNSHERLRILIERFWLRSCLRDATVLVQTPSVAAEVQKTYGRPPVVAPFAPAGALSASVGTKEYDFLYVASGEAHKNHRLLIEAWELLADQGHFPSLRLTLSATRQVELVAWMTRRIQSRSLKIENGEVALADVSGLYTRSRSLIYPSLFESFGLPLIEAQRAGLSIVAAERDYIRDVVVPDETFDPCSALSIARAVKRSMQVGQTAQYVPPADVFLTSLLEMPRCAY